VVAMLHAQHLPPNGKRRVLAAHDRYVRRRVSPRRAGLTADPPTPPIWNLF
jgi:hypothetical protein